MSAETYPSFLSQVNRARENVVVNVTIDAMGQTGVYAQGPLQTFDDVTEKMLTLIGGTESDRSIGFEALTAARSALRPRLEAEHEPMSVFKKLGRFISDATNTSSPELDIEWQNALTALMQPIGQDELPTHTD